MKNSSMLIRERNKEKWQSKKDKKLKNLLKKPSNSDTYRLLMKINEKSL